ncbi:MAG: UDP-N-acetylglucosamine diphosphorylase [Defluviitaleaceae bacterium]|nr:UDP-N-acetylglucosamine diphosphorylase [Defluviitaleaceae bacterium]MCL2274285.1 UDP-N-acetylglucosamine diphosphorylase [Defluviitaleaceae bacterium]
MKNQATIDRHIKNGVKIIDPSATYISEEAQIAAGVTVYPNAMLEGTCKIEAGASIGLGAHLKDTQVGENTRILSYSVLENARIGRDTQIGPFAYLRMNAVVGDNCRIGDFVEVKNSTVGNKTNAAHLAYIGDASVGNHVNIGCGVITANYDGKTKSRTKIDDHAFIGSNTNLIAPVEVGEWAYVAAGSTINKDIPAESLAIARARQEVKENWSKDPRRNAPA